MNSFSERSGGGQPPVKSEVKVRAQSSKVGRLWFGGVDAREFPGGPLRLNPTFAVCQASFLMTFATGGVPYAGSQQPSILE